MQKKISEILPAQSLIYIAICAAGILIAFFFGVYPYIKSIEKADLKIVDLRNRLETQKILYPFFKSLLEKTKEPSAVGIQDKELLPGAIKPENINRIFKEIAQKSGVILVDASADIRSIFNDNDGIDLRLVAEGRFNNLMLFAKRLLSVPFVQLMENIEISLNGSKKTAAISIRITEDFKEQK